MILLQEFNRNVQVLLFIQNLLKVRRCLTFLLLVLLAYFIILFLGVSCSLQNETFIVAHSAVAVTKAWTASGHL